MGSNKGASTLLEQMKLLEELHGHSGGAKKAIINSELWHACAGPLVSLPQPGTLVYYFPQGHSEQVTASIKRSVNTHIPTYPGLPSQVMCQVHKVTLHADKETDEIYAQMTLQPVISENDVLPIPDFGLTKSKHPTEFFCKTLTASDTSTHGGFSVPRRAAEKLFPQLDYSMQPPSQELVVRDLQDSLWTFRHIYRGQPRRHLLTTGWSVFVGAKRLKAGDSVIFIRDEKSQLLLGVRRASRQQTVLSSSVLSADSMHIGVLAAAAHATANRTPYTIYYNPRQCPSPFVVPLMRYHKATYGTRVSVGMRFGMMFETDDSSKRRYMGTITGISDFDPLKWPNSKWRNLQVEWDEHGCVERPDRVSLWEIETAESLLIFPPASILKRPFHIGIVGNEWKNDIKRPLSQGQERNNFLDASSLGSGGWMKSFPNFNSGFQTGSHQSVYASVLENLRRNGAGSDQEGIISSGLQQFSTISSGQQHQFSVSHNESYTLPSSLGRSTSVISDSVHQTCKSEEPVTNKWSSERKGCDELVDLKCNKAMYETKKLNASDSDTVGPSKTFQSLKDHQINSSKMISQAVDQICLEQLKHASDSPANFTDTRSSCSLFLNNDPTILLTGECQIQELQAETDILHLLQSKATTSDLGELNCILDQKINSSTYMDNIGISDIVNLEQYVLNEGDQFPCVLDNGASKCLPIPDPDALGSHFQSNNINRPFLSTTVLEQYDGSVILASGDQTNFTTFHSLSGSCGLKDFSDESNNPYEAYSSLYVDIDNDNILADPTVSCTNQQGLVTAYNSTLSAPEKGIISSFGSCQDVQSQVTSSVTEFSLQEFPDNSGGTSSSNIDFGENSLLNNGPIKQVPPPLRTFTKVQKLGSVGRSIDVTQFRNYRELISAIACMFGLAGQLDDPRGSGWKLVYVDYENDVLLVGDDPWEEFVKCVRCIRILSPAEVQQISNEGEQFIDDSSAYHLEHGPFLGNEAC